MNDEPTLTRPEIETRRERGWHSISLVWLVPVVAVAGALGLVWQSYSNRDVPIRIAFADATGIEPGKTEIRYREVVVGTVQSLRFSDDLDQVVAHAEINRDLAKYLDTETRFWLVTARVGPAGISGLNTLLSGSYIAADWDAVAGSQSREFVAETTAPAVPPGTKGRAVVLVAPDSGSISVGAPILHKGVPMGKVAAVRFDPLSGSVLISGFIEEPYDKLITSGTRFWNVSGIGLELGEGGVQLKVDSLASLLQGGIAFDTPMSGGEVVGRRPVFDLYPNEDTARDSLLGDSLQATIEVMSSFEGSVRGLKVGSEVLFRGVKVGVVKHLTAQVEEVEDSAPTIRMQVIYTVEPSRLGLQDVKTAEDTLSLLSTMVERGGLRARLMPASLFAGGLVVQLVEDADAEPATIDHQSEAFPVMPALPTPPDTLAVASQNVLDRISALPVEELMQRAILLLENVNAIVVDGDTRALPADIRSLVDNVNSVATSESLRGLPDDLRQAVASVNAVLDRFNGQKGAQKLVSALEEVQAAATHVSEFSAELPQLVSSIDDLVAKANALPLEEVVASADQMMKSADALLSNEDMEKVPGALSGALEQVQQVLAELQEGGAVENLNHTFETASDAADSVALAVKDLPELANRLNELADTAEATIGAYGPGSPVNREVQAAIGDLRSTVRSLNALVEAIRRKPNSLLVGR